MPKAISGSYNSLANTTALTVHDGSDNQTLNLTLVGNYSDSSWTLASDGHGGVDIVDPPGTTPAVLASGSDLAVATVASGGSLSVAGASSETVVFTGGTGIARSFDQASTFTGQIEGFTGTAPNAAHSDVVDLAGLNYNSGHFSESYNTSTGVLAATGGWHPHRRPDFR